MNTTDLSSFKNSGFNPGGNFLLRSLWYVVNTLIFNNHLLPINFIKTSTLKLFGAKVGKGVVIKPSVNIKYPWNLTIGDHTWIGENVWIDNLVKVDIGSHCCISQGAMLLTGNHNYNKQGFDLMTGNITLENGSWIGAKSTVCPGVSIKSHAVLTVGSIATSNLSAYGIYMGNPAKKIKERFIGEEA